MTATEFIMDAAVKKVNDVEMKEDNNNEISSSSESDASIDESIDEISDANNLNSTTEKKRNNKLVIIFRY